MKHLEYSDSHFLQKVEWLLSAARGRRNGELMFNVQITLVLLDKKFWKANIHHIKTLSKPGIEGNLKLTEAIYN